MKTCYYEKENGEYGWYLQEWTDTPACKCIMSVAEGRTLELNKLNKLWLDGTITDDELMAIRAFDWGHGKEEHLEVIKKIAEKAKVELVQK